VNETVLPNPIQSYTLVCSLPMKEEDMSDVKWSIEKGICWLHHNQNSDGSWSYTGRSGKGEKSPVGYSEKGGTRESVGVTSLAVLAFLNAGCDESVPTVSKAINWILSNKQPDGSIQTGWGVYDTNMAILALVATYNSNYNDAKQDAMNYIISAQNEDGDGLTTSDYQYGGWGYYRDNWDWSDLSNTQFALMALDAALLDKDSAVWTKADEYFITRCQNREATNPDYNFHDDGGFIYLPNSTIWAGGQSYGSMTEDYKMLLIGSTISITMLTRTTLWVIHGHITIS
jgi:squalene cyclase